MTVREVRLRDMPSALRAHHERTAKGLGKGLKAQGNLLAFDTYLHERNFQHN